MPATGNAVVASWRANAAAWTGAVRDGLIAEPLHDAWRHRSHGVAA